MEPNQFYMSTTPESNDDHPKKQYNDRIVDDMPDFSKFPLFVEKQRRAVEFLNRVGLPKEVMDDYNDRGE